MKTLRCIVLILAVSIQALFAGSGMFVTRVIHDSDDPLRIDLPANRFVKVLNFTQTTYASDLMGGIAVYQGAAGLAGVNVLIASIASTTHESHEDVYIAGPAIIYVAPVPGATLFLSYLNGSN